MSRPITWLFGVFASQSFTKHAPVGALWAIAILLATGCGGSGTERRDATPLPSADAGLPDGYAIVCTAHMSGCTCKLSAEAGAGLDRCSIESVSAGTSLANRTVCCAAGSTSCSCLRWSCHDYPTQGACVCQQATDDGTDDVAECPIRANTTCCLEDEGLQRCICGASPCGAGQRTVASCSVADLATCRAGYVPTAACRE